MLLLLACAGDPPGDSGPASNSPPVGANEDWRGIPRSMLANCTEEFAWTSRYVYDSAGHHLEWWSVPDDGGDEVVLDEVIEVVTDDDGRMLEYKLTVVSTGYSRTTAYTYFPDTWNIETRRDKADTDDEAVWTYTWTDTEWVALRDDGYTQEVATLAEGIRLASLRRGLVDGSVNNFEYAYEWGADRLERWVYDAESDKAYNYIYDEDGYPVELIADPSGSSYPISWTCPD